MNMNMDRNRNWDKKTNMNLDMIDLREKFYISEIKML
jgi:hypothetical protein